VVALANTEGAAVGGFYGIQTVNLFLRQFGVQLIANDRVFHIHEERPGAIGAAWLDDGPTGDALRVMKGLDRGAPVPLYRQRLTEGGHIKERYQEYGTLGGATEDEVKLATESRRKVNERIAALRDADAKWVSYCEAEEGKRLELAQQFPFFAEAVWDRYIRWIIDNSAGGVAKRNGENEVYDEVSAKLWGIEKRKAKLKRMNAEHRAWIATVTGKAFSRTDLNCGQIVI
jgi:hypothetical protein